MYAVIEYNDYRKEQNFEIIITTNDVDYAKKVAFHYAKKDISKYEDDDSICKITTKLTNEYLFPSNKIIISFRIINVVKQKKDYKIISYSTGVYAVVNIEEKYEVVEEIDNALICDNYHTYDEEDDDSNEEYEETDM